jgi:Tfp pilus assembly protein PilO
MDRSRLVNVGIIGAIALVAIFGWMIGISPILSQTATAQAQQATLVSNNSASAARLVLLKKQFSEIASLKGKLGSLQQSVPTQASIPEFLNEINSLASGAGVGLTSLTVNDALTYVAPTGGTAPASAAVAAPSPSPSPSESSVASPPVPAAASGPTSRLVVIPVSVIVSGSYSQVMAFSGALQSGPRLFLISTMSVLQSTTDGSFSAKLEGNVYALRLVNASVTSAASSVTPAPSAKPSLAPKPTPSGSPTTKP